MAYTTAFAGVEPDSAEAATPLTEPAHAPSLPKRQKRGLTLSVGTTYFTRHDLEEHLNQGETRTMYIFGSCTFADDIPPELVERVVAKFHLKGKLNASPAVREVLKRKGGETGKKHGPGK